MEAAGETYTAKVGVEYPPLLLVAASHVNVGSWGRGEGGGCWRKDTINVMKFE